MNKKKYSDEFKKKVILEVLKEEKTIAEISSKYEVHKCSIREWKNNFLENMHLAINKEKEEKIYKNKILELRSEIERIYKDLKKEEVF